MIKMARFSKTQILVVSMFAVIVIAPPAKANIMQVLMLIKNFITTNLTGFNASIQQESAGAQSQVNALKQKAEVISGVIANSTKTLGNLEYSMSWKGSGPFNSIAAVGCLLIDPERKGVRDAFEERAENTNKNEMPKLAEYARWDNPASIEEDKHKRQAVIQMMKDSNFPLSGIFPDDNITPAQRTVWGEYVKYLTVPSLPSVSGLSGGKAGNKAMKAFRYQQLIAPVQKVLLTYGDKYTVEPEFSGSRMNDFDLYKAAATSTKRIEAMVKKTGTGVAREEALAQSMLLNIESEIMETQQNITGLLASMAVVATDEVADSL